jgi:DNA-binding MarR family transcriptional regulator
MGKNNQNDRPLLPQKAYISLLSAADSARAVFEKICAGSEVTRQQYNVLRILRGAEPDGLPTLTIADRMIERAPGITRIIDRLEKKGFVFRMPCPDDRRFVYCRITEAGTAFLDAMDAPAESANSNVFSSLNDKELEQLIALLEKVRIAHQSEQEEKTK